MSSPSVRTFDSTYFHNERLSIFTSNTREEKEKKFLLLITPHSAHTSVVVSTGSGESFAVSKLGAAGKRVDTPHAHLIHLPLN